MKTIVRYIFAGIILPIYARFFIRTKTRKPKSDLKTTTTVIHRIDKRIQIETISIEKIDTKTSFLKNEVLIGITLCGKICNANNTLMIDYFERLNFIETINNPLKLITIEIIPILKSIHPHQKKSKLSSSKVNYDYQSDATAFEFKVEKVLVLSGFGNYSVEVKCAQKTETVQLYRYK